MALPGGGVARPLSSDSCVRISVRIWGITSLVGQGTERGLTQVWSYGLSSEPLVTVPG